MRKSIIVAILGLGMLFFVGIAGAASMTHIDITEFTTGGTAASEGYHSHGWGNVNYLEGSSDDINASYLDDGSFSVVLASLWGDFYIDKPVLEIIYKPSDPTAASSPVPEPATMFILGSGLIGVSFVGRKKFFKS